jgi:polyferredoxin
MAEEINYTKEYLLFGHEQNKELVSRYKENQKWLYYLIIGSFGLLTVLNFFIPNFHWIKPEPLNIEFGFIGMLMTFFGTVFFFSAIFAEGAGGWFDSSWWLRVILSIILLYFGIPMLFG